jgi:cytochrome c oxidase subunit 3
MATAPALFQRKMLLSRAHSAQQEQQMMVKPLDKKITGQESEYIVHPQKFVLWLFIVASVMLFASFTSAYIVRRGEGNWFTFDLPPMFLYSSIVIVASSVFMQWAYIAARKDELTQVRVALLATLGLGATFAVLQWLGWGQLVQQRVHFSGTPSESFVYVISGMHLLHIIAGILFVAIVTWKAFTFRVHKKATLSIYLCTTFWHFLGALWIYLYVFLRLNR